MDSLSNRLHHGHMGILFMYFQIKPNISTLCNDKEKTVNVHPNVKVSPTSCKARTFWLSMKSFYLADIIYWDILHVQSQSKNMLRDLSCETYFIIANYPAVTSRTIIFAWGIHIPKWKYLCSHIVGRQICYTDEYKIFIRYLYFYNNVYE